MRGITCPAVLTQAFLLREDGFGQCQCFGQAKRWPPHWKSVLAHFAKLIKAVSAVATRGRCCRSVHQFVHLKACLEAKLMRSPWVWTATEQNRLLGFHSSCSSYKALPLLWVQKRVLWLGGWYKCAVCRAELVPLCGNQQHPAFSRQAAAYIHLMEE